MISKQLAVAIAALSCIAAAPNIDSLVGWPSGDGVRQEISWEQRYLAQPSAANADSIERKLSLVPHRAGTPADYATALFVQDRLRKDGFDTTLVPYDALFTGPISLGVERLSPNPTKFDMVEGVPGHHTQWEKIAGPGFITSSADGAVSGPLYYANCGRPDDWTTLDKMGVAVPAGAVVILRTSCGGGYSPTANQEIYKALMAHHVGAVIAYDDPTDYGYVNGAVWPEGPYRSEYIEERKGDLYQPTEASYFDDPSLSGQIATPGVPHKTWFQIPHSELVEILVTANTAQQLMQGMSGQTVPAAWHDAHELVERFGGNQQVRVSVKMEHKIVRIWQVVGVMKGSTKPDELVLLGGHRDAMSFGAIDNGSGTTAILQIADGLAALRKAGWSPQRSIQIVSSDGHELGLFGTASYARQFGDYLNQHTFFSLGLDQITAGDNVFWAGIEPGTKDFIEEIGRFVPGIDGKPLYDTDPSRWTRHTYGPGETGDKYRAPGVTYGGYVEPFGAHHSAEDNIDGYQTYDPGYKKAVVVAQYNGIIVMRAAGAAVEPLRMVDHAQAFISSLETLKKQLPPGTDTTELEANLQRFLAAGRTVDAALADAEARDDLATMQIQSAKQMAARAAFWDPQPNSIRMSPYIDNASGAYPDVTYALDHGLPAKVAPALARINAAIVAATQELLR